MPTPPTGRRLRKREIAFALVMGALAAGGAGALLSTEDDHGAPPPQAAAVEEQTYTLGEFERIATFGPQDIEIEYGETHSVRAEGLLSSLEVLVENGELIIRPRGGIGSDWPGFDSTRFYVTVPRLTRVALNGPGEISIDKVVSNRFVAAIEGSGGELEIDGLEVEEAEFTIDGPGSIAAAGTTRATRVTINGPGEVQAGELQSRTAVIAVRGPGDVELAVEEEADVSVDGPGEVDIDGPARCIVSASGSGSVSCRGQDRD